ncbi:MAG: hypothetical protein ACREH8_10125 [Opitutaceae bacterium]
MISRDYTKEVGIPSHKKTVRRPLAFVVLAIVAAGVSFGVAGVVVKAKEHNEAEKAAANPPAAAFTPGVSSPAAEPAAAK